MSQQHAQAASDDEQYDSSQIQEGQDMTQEQLFHLQQQLAYQNSAQRQSLRKKKRRSAKRSQKKKKVRKRRMTEQEAIQQLLHNNP